MGTQLLQIRPVLVLPFVAVALGCSPYYTHNWVATDYASAKAGSSPPANAQRISILGDGYFDLRVLPSNTIIHRAVFLRRRASEQRLLKEPKSANHVRYEDCLHLQRGLKIAKTGFGGGWRSTKAVFRIAMSAASNASRKAGEPYSDPDVPIYIEAAEYTVDPKDIYTTGMAHLRAPIEEGLAQELSRTIPEVQERMLYVDLLKRINTPLNAVPRQYQGWDELDVTAAAKAAFAARREFLFMCWPMAESPSRWIRWYEPTEIVVEEYKPRLLVIFSAGTPARHRE